MTWEIFFCNFDLIARIILLKEAFIYYFDWNQSLLDIYIGYYIFLSQNIAKYISICGILLVLYVLHSIT